MAVRFNKAMDVKLIRMVKDNEVLYNSKHANYNDSEIRNEIWQKIAETLNRPPRHCKKRWVNIRDQMRKNLRDRLRKLGQNAPMYKYENELSFMVPVFKNLSGKSTEYPDLDTDSDVRSEILYVPDPEFKDEEKPLSSLRDSIDIRQLSEMPDSYNLSNSGYNTSQSLNSADHIDVFLMTLGSTLRKLNPYYLNQAKSKLFQVVQEYELQQMVNKDHVPGSSEN